MDSHLEVLARKHFDTMVTKIHVENAPFLVQKLNVQVLPCLIAWVDGKSVDRIVGFEGELGNTDSFQTAALESRLIRCGMFDLGELVSILRQLLTHSRYKRCLPTIKDNREYQE